MSAYREWRERVVKAWNDLDHTTAMGENFWRALASRPPLPPEVLEARRVWETDEEQFYDERMAGDQAAIDRNEMYAVEMTQAEHNAGIHRDCVHDEAHDDREYMSSMGYAAEPMGVVWGTVNPGGSVTARGFRDDESFSDDSAVHPVTSLVAYHAEDNTWVHMASGQTTERQREIDAERAVRPPTNGERRVQELQVGKDATGAKFDPPQAAQPWTPKGADVNETTKGAVEGASTITPTGLAAAAASGVTDKDIKSPLAAATTGGATSGGGAGVSHAEEGNAQIQQAGQDIEAAMGAIQEIVNQLEAAQKNLTGAAEGSQHSEADTAMGALQEAVSAANDLQQQVGAAKQAVEDVKL